MRLRTALLCAMGLGIVVGGVGAAYVMGNVVAAQDAVKPPRSQDWGGYVHRYMQKAELQRGTLHEIPRICFSACTVWADQMGHWACLGPKSQLGFHQQWSPEGGFARPPYSPALDAVLPNPLPRGGGWWMPREVALQFWPECRPADHRR